MAALAMVVLLQVGLVCRQLHAAADASAAAAKAWTVATSYKEGEGRGERAPHAERYSWRRNPCEFGA